MQEPQTLIRVVDIETTGFAPPAEVIEIGWFDMLHRPDLPQPFFIGNNASLARPTASIPPETSAVHHLIDTDFADAPDYATALAFATRPNRLYRHAAIMAAHNAKFERQWLEQPFGATPWICTYKCALRLWPDAPSHGNQVLRYWLNPPGLDRSYANAVHRAAPDAYVTAFLLHAMTQRASLADLIAWSNQPALLPRINFGKHRGTKWSEVEGSYLMWLLRQDFDEDTLFTARAELERRQAQHQAGG